jgi:uncharacterized membrane protein YhaH (DUF805 family)
VASIVSNEFLFSFKGRINRAKYWYALLASTIFCLIFLMILSDAIAHIFGVDVAGIDLDFQDIFRHFPSLPFHISFDNAGPTSAAALWFYAIGTPVVAVGIWFLSATTIKRLHDRGRSGWWIVVFEIAPPMLHRLWDGLGHSHSAIPISELAVILNVWGIIELLFLTGTKGSNRFGPDPLAPPATGGTGPGWDQPSELEFAPHSAGPSPGAHVKRGP